MDSFKHVNNSVYLNYLETVRWNFFRDFSMMEELEREKLYPVVIEVNVKYIKELRLFDQFVIISRYWIENNYIVSDHKAVCKDQKSTMMKARVVRCFLCPRTVLCMISHLVSKRYFQQRNQS